MKWNVLLGVVIGLIVAVFLFLFTFALLPSAEPALPPGMFSLMKDIVGPVAAGFGGAIAGAFASYFIQSAAENRKKLEQECVNYSAAIGILISKINELGSIKKAMIVPCQDEQLRFFTIRTVPKGDVSKAQAAPLINDLLIRYGLSELFVELGVAEEYYLSMIWSVNHCGDYIARYRDEQRKHTLGKQREISLSTLKEIHGVSGILQLYSFVEGFILALDEAIAAMINVMERVQKELAPKLRIQGAMLLNASVPDNEVLKRTPEPFYKNSEELAAMLDDF